MCFRYPFQAEQSFKFISHFIFATRHSAAHCHVN